MIAPSPGPLLGSSGVVGREAWSRGRSNAVNAPRCPGIPGACASRGDRAAPWWARCRGEADGVGEQPGCGAKTKAGSRCRKPAMKGTSRCELHQGEWTSYTVNRRRGRPRGSHGHAGSVERAGERPYSFPGGGRPPAVRSPRGDVLEVGRPLSPSPGGGGGAG
ncbi:HGGxSTG domain-containing protein, partial [Streptomyces alkaliphilus]|uniref:HGGxSTG domain-containing protein n=1 Tax=Streptomyces alkaliphilus TaxID=1472722 RepID=UPI002B20D439